MIDQIIQAVSKIMAENNTDLNEVVIIDKLNGVTYEISQISMHKISITISEE